MKRVSLSLLLLLAVFLSSIPSAFGQVQTRLRIIEASNEGATVDPSLRDVHDQLGSLFNFQSYRLLRDQQLKLSPDAPFEISAHRTVSLEVTLVKQRKKRADFRVIIRREGKEILNTQVRLSPERTVLIGGPKHGKGIVILALSARF